MRLLFLLILSSISYGQGITYTLTTPIPKEESIPQHQDLDTFVSYAVGEWVNVDPDTQSNTRFVISNQDGLKVHGYGKCGNGECDWGEVTLNKIATTTSKTKNKQPFDYLMGIWEDNFSTTIVKMTLIGEVLSVEVTKIFKDDSRRSSYHNNQEFLK
jgi:hypothetical protein